jgi:hypothetical protein
MNKVIKEFNINTVKNNSNTDLVYQFWYNLWNNKVYPRIDIYKNEKLLSRSYWTYEIYGELFYFDTDNSSLNSYGHVVTMKRV